MTVHEGENRLLVLRQEANDGEDQSPPAQSRSILLKNWRS